MPIDSRSKGARGEREWAELLTKYGFESRRGSQNGVKDGLDVWGDIPGWRGEVKRREGKPKWGEWFEQAANAAGALSPYVAWRRNHGQWRVRCYSSDLFGRGPFPTATDLAGVVVEMDGEDFLGFLARRRDLAPVKVPRVDPGPATPNVAG